MVMLNHLLERVRLPDRGVIWLGDEDEVAGPNAADRHRAPRRVPARARAAGLALRGRRLRDREAHPDAARAEHRARDLPAARRRRARCGSTLRPSVHFRALRGGGRRVAGADLHRSRRPASGTSCRRGRRPARAADDAARHARGADARREGHARQSRTGWRRRRGYEWMGSLWSPGYFRADARGRRAGRRWSRRPNRGTVVEALSPDAARGAETERRRRLIAIADAARRRHASRRSSCWRPTSSSSRPAGRVEETRAGPCGRRRGPHGDRRLSLVHRLGPRHDDQPRGADARRPAAIARPATSCAPSRTTCATA